MLYLLSEKKNSFGLVEYDHKQSIDFSLFSECLSLQPIADEIKLVFNVTKRINASKLSELHYLNSTGPILVSSKFKALIESVAPGDAEFYNATVKSGNQEITGFFGLNILKCISCMDMDKSEYQQTNFDPNDPTYMFTYMHLREQRCDDPGVALCREQKSRLIVNSIVKQACFGANLRGLVFYRTLDMTYGNRTQSEAVP